ncbi:MAG: hypothetical protein JW888_00665 [Pirellulales bacterium]|nr:hypothetical protein [Pirellulales bacterium]
MSTDRFGRQDDWGDLDHCTSAVQCKIRSFAQFSRWLDGELAKLERRWLHLAVKPSDRDRPFHPSQPR